MTMDHHNNHLKLEITETFHASNAIQLRTHPPHTTINFSELGKKLLESARYGDTDVVLELINSGAPFTTDWLGASPLHYAAQYGNVETVETLLRSGIAKDARTKIDRTALHIAAQEGSLETATVLVNFGCDVDAKDMLRMTPLHWAVQRGHRDIVELLLNNGADVRIVNKFDKTPIDVAYSCGHDDFVPLLKSFLGKVRPKVNPIDSAIQIKLMKNQSKNRSKILNSVRNMNKLSSPQQQQSIKQELDEEIRHISSSASSDGFNPISTSSNTSNKIIITKRTSIDSNQLQNGQTIAGSGKLIVNNNSISSNFGSNNSQKIYTFNPSNSNLVLLSSSSGGSGTIGGGNKINDGSSSGSIKVMTTVGSNMKKPVFTEIKDVKTLEKLQFFNASNKNGRGVSGGSGGGQPQIIKRLVINPNQATAAAMNSSLIQEKDSEIARLKEENQKLRNDCDEMRNLIISKDLEIERLKKMKTVHHSTTTKTTNVTSKDTHEDAMNDNNTIDTNDQQLVSSIPPSSNSPPTIELEDDEQLD